MFVGATLLPDYFSKNVEIFIALAPVVKLDMGLSNSLRNLAKNDKIIEEVILFTHMYNIFPRNPKTSQAHAYFCKLVPQVCSALQESIKLNDKIDNLSREPDEAAHKPSGAGYRNLIHYAQIINSKTFQRFDYGKEVNLQKYGQETPPKYDLSKIGVKIAVYHGDVDVSSDLKDVAWLLSKDSGLR